MNAPHLIADIAAEVYRRVLGFAATQDIRYYLNGVHVVPGATTEAPLRLEATNGHFLYVEEDKSGTAQKDLIVNISPRGRALLRGANRVKVYADHAVHITNPTGEPLYIEPGKGVVDGKFPAIEHLLGVPSDWHEGLGATVNTKYLQQVLTVPGYVRFFSRKDAEGRFDPRNSVMFVMDGGTTNGGKAFGLIMPVRGQFEPHSTVADMLPASLLPRRGAGKEAA